MTDTILMLPWRHYGLMFWNRAERTTRIFFHDHSVAVRSTPSDRWSVALDRIRKLIPKLSSKDRATLKSEL
jgi:hypothetical protein